MLIVVGKSKRYVRELKRVANYLLLAAMSFYPFVLVWFAIGFWFEAPGFDFAKFHRAVVPSGSLFLSLCRGCNSR
jgi:hypothetical protein